MTEPNMNLKYNKLFSQWPNLKNKPIKRIGQERSTSLEIYDIETIFDLFDPDTFFIPNISRPKPILHGHPIKLTSIRMKLFLREYLADKFFCVNCNLIPSHWSLEKEDANYSCDPGIHSHGIHLNLFGLKETGKNFHEILFTRDHILPAAKGGTEGLYNMQLMCTVCNAKKGHAIDEDLLHTERKPKIQLGKWNFQIISNGKLLMDLPHSLNGDETARISRHQLNTLIDESYRLGQESTKG